MAEMQSNRNDDLFGSTDKQFGVPNIDSLALKYSKAQLQQMAQMGRIPPIYAVMAGMAQDRIQLNNSHAPETTVAQDTFGQQVTDSSGQGITDSSGAAVGAGERVAPQSAADISKAYGGLMSIPRPGEKYNQDNFATGGIVAFQEGGSAYSKALRESEPWKFLHSLKPSNDPMGDRQRRIAEIDAAPAIFRDDMMAELRGTEGAASSEPFQGSRLNLSPKERLAAAEADLAAGKTPSTVDVETQKQLDKVKPAAGPLAAMAQQGAPASDEFAQQGMNALKLPKRTPADTTGLVDTPETIAKNKKDLLYRTVGYTGAEMMAGKSPFAMVNIGEALSKGFSAYAQQIGEHKKATKEDIKDLAAIKRGEEALAQGDLKLAVDIQRDELNNKSALERVKLQVDAQDRATQATRGATQAYRDEQQYGINVRNAETEFDKFRTNLAKKLAPGGSLWKQSQADPSLESTLENAERIRLGRVHKLPGYADAVENPAPPIGTVVDGYMFKGGNPKLKESWTKS